MGSGVTGECKKKYKDLIEERWANNALDPVSRERLSSHQLPLWVSLLFQVIRQTGFQRLVGHMIWTFASFEWQYSLAYRHSHSISTIHLPRKAGWNQTPVLLQPFKRSHLVLNSEHTTEHVALGFFPFLKESYSRCQRYNQVYFYTLLLGRRG